MFFAPKSAYVCIWRPPPPPTKCPHWTTPWLQTSFMDSLLL